MKNRDIKVAEMARVDLSSCTREALDGLPSGLRVKGDLYLWGCENLETLPSGLVVAGDLYLHGCKNLKALPSGLVVGGDLSLEWCEKLKDLPLGLQVAGTIHYNDDTGFARDEKNIQDLEMRFPGQLKKS